MWSKNYIYSVLVEDYRSTFTFAKKVTLCHENYSSVKSGIT